MTIKTSTFGRVELSGNEAARFRRHMTEDKPNPQAQASLVRGRVVLRQISYQAEQEALLKILELGKQQFEEELTAKALPQYEQDDGPLTAEQMRQINLLTSLANKSGSVRSNLFPMKSLSQHDC